MWKGAVSDPLPHSVQELRTQYLALSGPFTLNCLRRFVVRASFLWLEVAFASVAFVFIWVASYEPDHERALH
jgi:hypothetical protein